MPRTQRHIALLKQALAIDPNYVAALDALAIAYGMQASFGMVPGDEGYRMSRDMANKALALDPDNSQALTQLADIALRHEGNLSLAARYMQRALDTGTNDLNDLNMAEDIAKSLGRMNDAVAINEYIIARDPLQSIAYSQAGIAYQQAGMLDKSLSANRTALELEQGQLITHFTSGVSLLLQGRAQLALAEMKLEPFEAFRLFGLAVAHHSLGNKAQSDAALAETVAKYGKDAAYNIAYIHAWRGEPDQAFEWLDKAVEYKDSGLADGGDRAAVRQLARRSALAAIPAQAGQGARAAGGDPFRRAVVDRRGRTGGLIPSHRFLLVGRTIGAHLRSTTERFVLGSPGGLVATPSAPEDSAIRASRGRHFSLLSANWLPFAASSGGFVKGLPLEVLVSPSPELKARAIEQATRALSGGDRASAEQAYQAAAQAGLLHPVSWSNLAALGVALGDAEGACQHAQRALQLDPRSRDGWVNFGVASWHVGRRRDAAQAMDHALKLKPGLEAAALNLCLMLRSIPDNARAASILATALRHNPNSWRLYLEDAEVSRLLMQHSRVRHSILRALRLRVKVLDPTQPGTSGLRPPSGTDVRAALQAACDRLDALGVSYHLMAGTLLAIVKDGRLFPHDKDVDLALPDLDDASVARVHASLAGDAEFLMFPPPPQHTGRLAVIGVIHQPTGVGIDLMLPHRQADGAMLNEMGWPDQLESVLRPYAIGTLAWQGREWPVPVPTEQYLADLYGEDWREQVTESAGVVFDRCYSDTTLSNPRRTAGTIPMAVNLGLIRLMHALDRREWAKAVAYCAQLLHREPLPEVQAILTRLQAAGHDGLRFDG